MDFDCLIQLRAKILGQLKASHKFHQLPNEIQSNLMQYAINLFLSGGQGKGSRNEMRGRAKSLQVQAVPQPIPGMDATGGPWWKKKLPLNVIIIIG